MIRAELSHGESLSSADVYNLQIRILIVIKILYLHETFFFTIDFKVDKLDLQFKPPLDLEFRTL